MIEDRMVYVCVLLFEIQYLGNMKS